MATIRKWLNNAGFDWENGIILYQHRDDPYDPVINAKYIDHEHSILDKQFDTQFGSSYCPDFIAQDNKAIYFPGTYDGATWIEKVYLDLDKYLDYKNFPTPFIGGG